MGKRRRKHSSNEFGRQGSGLAGLDAPMIGAAGAIFSDALTEHESGVTPPPPPISVRTLVITLVVMFVLGAAGVSYFIFAQQASAPPAFPFSYSSSGTGAIDGAIDGIGTDEILVATSAVSSADGEPRYREPELRRDRSTAFLINGRPLSTSASNDTTVTIYDVNGWTVHVEYRRQFGSKLPLATRVEFHASESDIQGALDRP